MARILRRSFRRGRPARGVTWIATDPQSETTVALPQTMATQLLTVDMLDKFTDPTLMRVRGYLRVAQTPANTTAAHGVQVSAALTVVDENLITTADLLDGAQLSRDVLWHWYGALGTTARARPYWNGSSVQTMTSWENDPWGARDIVIDSKAMRKIAKGEVLLFSMSVDSTAGSQTVSYRAQFRCLIKE